jgi:Heparinase II/III-like protein/Heparinase II/III N-terminus
VASEWHKKASRLANMGQAEVRERIGQEVRKRGDWTRYRLGLLPIEKVSSVDNQRCGAFFFDAEEVTRRVDLLRSGLPERAAAIVQEADEISQHRFRLLGYEALDYGQEIDWHLDAVHQKKAPLKPWFKIDFLDFAEVGDHKITWELNRHQFLVTLAKAARLTDNPRYVGELIEQWRHWQRTNPYPLGINWGSSLEVAFRTLSWIWVDHLLPRSDDLRTFRDSLHAALAGHGRYIERFLSTYFSPNTHLLGEIAALFFLGTLYPNLPRAYRWRTLAWEVLLQEAGRQVRPDGVYFEQSLHYHVYAVDFFLHARLLAGINGVQVPEKFDATLNKMLDVIQALAQAGSAEGFGDDDGGRLFDARRNRTEHATDPLALGTLLYERSDLAAARLTEEAIWLFGEKALKQLSQTSERDRELKPAAFVDGGIYVMVGSQPVAHELVIDAGPQGVGRCGHGHADALSVRLTAGGERWLVDSGSGVYIGPDGAQRDAFRGTGAHNTLRVDGREQAIPGDPFSWTNIPTTAVEQWVVGKTFQFFVGRHDGYARFGSPVVHRRSVLMLADGLCMIRDEGLGTGLHDLEVNWHFAPQVQLFAAGEGVVAKKPDCEVSLRLFLGGEREWRQERIESRLSPAYGAFEPCLQLRSSTQSSLPAETVSVLIVGDGDLNAHETCIASHNYERASAYQFQTAEMTHSLYFSRTKGWWQAGPWSSDAPVLYGRTRGAELQQLVLIDGSQISFQGEQVLAGTQAMAWFEWSKENAGVQTGANINPAPRLRTDRSFAAVEFSKSAQADYVEKR